MILVVDCRDSFVHNLVAMLRSMDGDVVANGVDEFPYDLIAEVEANDPTKFWDVLPPTLPDSFPPAQPGAGEFIYENSVPVPGEWNWRKA